MNLAKLTPKPEIVSLPVPELDEIDRLVFSIKPEVFDRLVIIMSQAFDAEAMANSVGTYLYGQAGEAIASAAVRIVEELPLGQFDGWNAPSHGGEDRSLPPES